MYHSRPEETSTTTIYQSLVNAEDAIEREGGHKPEVPNEHLLLPHATHLYFVSSRRHKEYNVLLSPESGLGRSRELGPAAHRRLVRLAGLAPPYLRHRYLG